MPFPRRLYEFPSAFAEIDAAIDERDGELPDDIAERLDALQLSFEAKVDAVLALRQEAIREAEACRAEAKRFGERARRAENRADDLGEYVMSTLESMDAVGIKTPHFKASVQINSRPSIHWLDPSPIPEEFQRVTISLDGDTAYKAWREGQLPDGFTVVRGRHLRVS